MDTTTNKTYPDSKIYQKQIIEKSDKELRLEIVKMIIDLHKEKGADNKRLKDDFIMTYGFIMDVDKRDYDVK